MFRKALLGVTAMTLFSYGAEYMAFTAVLAWLYNLLTGADVAPLEAYGLGFLASSGYLLVSGVLAVPFGSLSDRFGRRRMAFTGCLVAGVSILALPLTATLGSANLIILTISTILLAVGTGHGTYTASALAYAGDVSSGQDVGQAYGLVETAEYGMFMFGTPLGFVFANAFGIVPTFITTGFLFLLGSLAAILGMPPPAGTGAAQGVALAGSDRIQKPTMALGPQRTELVQLYQAIRDPGVLVALFGIFFVSIGFTAFRIYMTQYGSSGQAVPFVGPYLVSLMAIASVLSGVPIGRTVDSSHRRLPVMILGLVTEAIALTAILVGPSAISLVGWSVVFGVAIMLVRVPQAVVIAERTAISNRAGAMGANHAVEHVGYGIGAFLGGLFIVSFGLSLLQSFVIFAVLTLAAGLALVPLWYKKKLE